MGVYCKTYAQGYEVARAEITGRRIVVFSQNRDIESISSKGNLPGDPRCDRRHEFSGAQGTGTSWH